MLNGGLSGSAGPVTFIRRRSGGTYIRQRDTPTDPATNRQIATREAMVLANASFAMLTVEEMRAWKDYAARQADLAWADRMVKQVNALNAYRALALKWIQVNGYTEPPRLPPATPFGGDGVLVTATAGEPHTLALAASGPNSSGVVTELLIQPLRIAVSTPDLAKHRHVGFVRFETGHLEEVVAAPSGWLSPAVRFVLQATGQASGVLLLEPVFVA